MKTNRELKTDLIKQLMALEACEKDNKITTPSSVLPELKKYTNRKQEEFIVITLSGSHKVIKTRSVCKGLLNRTMVHPREIYRVAISDNSAAIIIAH